MGRGGGDTACGCWGHPRRLPHRCCRFVTYLVGQSVYHRFPPNAVSIDLLPVSGLDLSVLVAVLLGTLVLFYLSEAFGWSFGGLVVPGYLASVLLVSPAAGATVVAEAFLTLAVVVLISDGLALTGLWSRFFGRERFLLIVVVSILVRQSSEIWLWPSILAEQERWLGFTLLQPVEAHSVGLVLVPLTANALGKGSLRTGLIQLVVPTLLAWLLLRDVLLPGTNLSFSAMSLTYEDASLDFLQSARAYFVLLSGAFLATRFNGAFAWSSGGILIPALLGLAWYEPARVLTTFAEAIVIALVFQAIRRVPVARHWNLEGARKLALLFLLCAGLRLGLAWAHELGLLLQTREFSGLGYLISALVALKILQSGSVPKVVLPALGTSLLAFGGGLTAAWGMEQVFPADQSSGSVGIEPPTARLLLRPEGVVEYARVRTRLDPERSPSIHLPASRLAGWRELWRQVEAGLGEGAAALPTPPGDWLALRSGAGTFGGRRWYIVHEPTERLDEVAGWGVGLVRQGALGPALVVEKPWADAEIARGAIARCIEVDCAILYLSGMELPTGTDDARAAWAAALQRPVETLHAAPPVAAALAVEAPALGLGAAVEEALRLAPESWAASASELEFLTSTLVPAMANWASGAGTLAELRDLAGVLDYSVIQTTGCGPRPCLLVAPQHAGPVVVVRQEGRPVLATASHPLREVGTLKIALGVFEST